MGIAHLPALFVVILNDFTQFLYHGLLGQAGARRFIMQAGTLSLAGCVFQSIPDVTVGIEDLTYGLDPILIFLGPCKHEPLLYRLERTIIKVIKEQADSIDYSLYELRAPSQAKKYAAEGKQTPAKIVITLGSSARREFKSPRMEEKTSSRHGWNGSRHRRDNTPSGPQRVTLVNSTTLSKMPKTKPAEPLVEHEIRLRAYDLYEQRRRAEGHALEDWLQAEAEIRETPGLGNWPALSGTRTGGGV